MKRPDLLLSPDSETLYRVLDVTEGEVLVVNCLKKAMPEWIAKTVLYDFRQVDETTLFLKTDYTLTELSEATPSQRRKALERYTMIAGILTSLGERRSRYQMIEKAASDNGVSKQTVRNYLQQYLVYQDIGALIPQSPEKKTELSADQKNMRWALNKFFYTQNKNSLNNAYIMMLKEKYTSSDGKLKAHPTVYQFRYFYRKTRKMEKYYIQREEIKAYQRDHRPLLGDGVQAYAPQIGTAYLDGTTGSCTVRTKIWSIVRTGSGKKTMHCGSKIRIIRFSEKCSAASRSTI